MPTRDLTGGAKNALAALIMMGATTTAQGSVVRTPASNASTLLDKAIQAQGCAAALRAITSMTVRAQGYRNMLEQSERPEGPYIVEYNLLTETRDHAHNRYRSVTESSVSPNYHYTQGIVADQTAAMRLGGPNPSPGDAETLAAAHEAMALSPERLLLTAREAADVRLGSPATLQSVPQDIVTFTLDGSVARLFLNHYTHLPTALDYSGALARTGYWRRLGNVQMRILYSYWAQGQHDVRMPLQWDIYRNGLHDSTYSTQSLTLDAPAADADMAIPADVRVAFASIVAKGPPKLTLGLPGKTPIDAAPRMTIIPGSWNVAIVRQTDGVVIVEAPISSAYSEEVIAEAARRYPGIPIKGVVSTSDSWPHIAGLRAYVARGIPIYALDLNRPAIERLVEASYSSKPDALQRHPVPMRFVAIAGKTALGRGANRMELYPMHGETSERQVMVYWPELHLLYGSDPFQEMWHSAQMVSELADAVDREHLSPDRFYMMHMPPTPWSALVAIANDESTKSFPDGSPK